MAAPPPRRRTTVSRGRHPLTQATAALVFVGAVAVLFTGAVLSHVVAPTEAPRALPDAGVMAKASFVGRAVCAPCHAKEMATWTGSHHDRAMQPATPANVQGDFAGGTLSHAGVTTSFFRRGDDFMVRTDGPTGALEDLPIRFTFGVAPLQQYLVELSGGRLQALDIAWDARPLADGGQRWFHLHPGERIDPGDALHWTGPRQSWNAMCADCHSTDVHRRYDARSGAYDTRMAELDVSCEACHGPGSAHVAWANGQEGDVDGGKGLVVRLDERRGVTWDIDPATGNARRSRPRGSTREIDACARCHARRGELGGDYEYGSPIGQSYRVALLDDGLYFPDGQIRDEVFEYGSFLQSRMFHAGVTCADCHEPHGLSLRAEGSTVCLQCHAVDRYRTPAHHHHPSGSKGAACVACHMPARAYMVVDVRRDHSFRIPRPDRTLTMGVPNVCHDCHSNRGAGWAVEQLKRWYGAPAPGFQRFAEALHAGDAGAPGATGMLLRVAEDRTEPGIARASALGRLGSIPNDAALGAVRRLLDDEDPLVRRAAVTAYGLAPAIARGDLLPRLDDSIRDVRLEAARRLAALPAGFLPPGAGDRVSRGVEDYLAAQRAQADRAEAQSSLGALQLELGRTREAEASLSRALALDPSFAPAAVNLVEALHRAGRDSEGEAVLRRMAGGGAAVIHHSLGLWLVRAGRREEALGELRKAADLAPEEAHFGCVLGIALEDAGHIDEARRVFEGVLFIHPYHRDSLRELLSLERDHGRLGRAAELAARLQELEHE